MLMRPYGDRSGVVIEPYLTDQWFVRAGPLAKPAIEAVKDGRIRLFRTTGAKLISTGWKTSRTGASARQLWWGHRIPAWYDHEGNFYVAANARRCAASTGWPTMSN